MESLDSLENNLSALLTRCHQLLEENRQLRYDYEQQRQEVIRSHQQLADLQTRFRQLETAHVIASSPEEKERAKQLLNNIIARVDRAIEALRQ